MTFTEYCSNQMYLYSISYQNREYFLYNFFLLSDLTIYKCKVDEDSAFESLNESLFINEEEFLSTQREIIRNNKILSSKDWKEKSIELNIPGFIDDKLDDCDFFLDSKDPITQIKESLLNPNINFYNKKDNEHESFSDAREEFLDIVLKEEIFKDIHDEVIKLYNNIKTIETVNKYLLKFHDNDFIHALRDTALILMNSVNGNRLPLDIKDDFTKNKDKYLHIAVDLFSYFSKHENNEYFKDLDILINDEVEEYIDVNDFGNSENVLIDVVNNKITIF